MNVVKCGDAKVLSQELESESIDFIWTDPIYKNLPDYEWLGKESYRLLKPNRALMVWGSQRLVKDYIPLIEKSGLKYMWTFSYVVIAKTSRLIKQNIFMWTTPCLFFAKKGFSLFNRAPDTFLEDVLIDDTFVDYAGVKGKVHLWNKSLPVFLYWMPVFSQPYWTIFDPFMGYGNSLIAAKKLNRQGIGFDLNPECVEMAGSRLEVTMPDLFEENSIAGLF